MRRLLRGGKNDFLTPKTVVNMTTFILIAFAVGGIVFLYSIKTPQNDKRVEVSNTPEREIQPEPPSQPIQAQVLPIVEFNTDISFVAIDFETANSRRGSACAIGMCKVENGLITDRYVKVLRPEPFEFERRNIAIHGIDEDQARQAPTIAEDWESIKKFVGDLPLVAHNASFDKSVLDRSLEACGEELSGWNIDCTMLLSKQLFPKRSNYKLDDLSREFGIELNHHDAGSDAEACAQLRLVLSNMNQSESVKTQYIERVQKREIKEVFVEAKATFSNENKHLDGLSIVFTGTFSGFTREQIEPLAHFCGAKIQNTVTERTNYVIKGNIDSSSTLTKAEFLNIPILTEKEFFSLMYYGKLPLRLKALNPEENITDLDIAKRLNSSRATVSRIKREIKEMEEGFTSATSQYQYEKYEKLLYNLKQWEETKASLEALKGNVQKRERKY
jgi:DNA polymerase-3 subunit epsilon